jgi:hypothetical protein
MKNEFTESEVRYIARALSMMDTARERAVMPDANRATYIWYLSTIGELMEDQKLVGIELVRQERLEESARWCRDMIQRT